MLAKTGLAATHLAKLRIENELILQAILGSASYSRKIRNARPTWYWPLWDASGTLATEIMGKTAEALANTGFETAGAGGADVFASWAETASDGAIASEGTLFHAGAAAAKITAGASGDTNIAQQVTVLPGQSITLALYTRGDGTNPGRYRVYDDSNAADIVASKETGVAGTTYTLVAETFTTPAACRTITVYLICPIANGGIAYFDDVTLTAPAHAEYHEHGAGVITLGQPGIGDGKTAATLAGDDTSIYIGSSALASAWDGDTFSMIGWAKVDAAARWTDLTTYRYLHHQRASNDDTYYTVMGHSQTNHQLEWRRRSGGAIVSQTYTFSPAGPTTWFCMGMTVAQSKPLLSAYLWSLPTGFVAVGTSNSAALTAWGTHPISDPNKCLLGAGSSTLQEWIGSLAHMAIWCGSELAQATMQRLMTP